MTLAAGIEIGTGVTPAHVQGKFASAAIGAGDVEAVPHGSAAAGAASGSSGGTQSFREGWQSLLASLGCAAEGFSQIEPETDGAFVGEVGLGTGSGTGEAAIKPSVAAAAPAERPWFELETGTRRLGARRRAQRQNSRRQPPGLKALWRGPPRKLQELLRARRSRSSRRPRQRLNQRRMSVEAILPMRPRRKRLPRKLRLARFPRHL